MDQHMPNVLKDKFRVAVIVWIAFIVSVCLYAGLAEWLTRTGRIATMVGSGNAKQIHFLFLMIAVLLFLSIAPLKRLLLYRGVTPKVTDVAILAGKLLNASLITFALSESIGLLGLVEYFLLGSRQSFYLFLIISLVSFTVHMPRYTGWSDYLEKMTGTPVVSEPE